MTSKTLRRYQSPYEIATTLVGSSGFNRDDVGWDLVITHQASNTVGYGDTLDPRLDITDSRVWQQASSGAHQGKIIPAADALYHYDYQANKVGSVVGFAIRAVQHLPLNRRILILPCSRGGFGYADASWSPGGSDFEDVVARANAIITASPRSRVLCFYSFIHGGNDIGFWAGQPENYKIVCRRQIDKFRELIKNAAAAPFIIGGLAEQSMSGSTDRTNLNNYIRDTLPTERARVHHVSTVGVTAQADNLHFDANGQRVMAERAYQVFRRYL